MKTVFLFLCVALWLHGCGIEPPPPEQTVEASPQAAEPSAAPGNLRECELTVVEETPPRLFLGCPRPPWRYFSRNILRLYELRVDGLQFVADFPQKNFIDREIFDRAIREYDQARR